MQLLGELHSTRLPAILPFVSAGLPCFTLTLTLLLSRDWPQACKS